LNGKAVHLLPTSALHHASPSKRFSTYPHTHLKAFAETCVKILGEWNCCSIVHGLVRVDIMQTKDGNFVLNEFESFEANYYSKSHTNEAIVEQFLCEFWKNELLSLIISPLNN